MAEAKIAEAKGAAGETMKAPAVASPKTPLAGSFRPSGKIGMPASSFASPLSKPSSPTQAYFKKTGASGSGPDVRMPEENVKAEPKTKKAPVKKKAMTKK